MIGVRRWRRTAACRAVLDRDSTGRCATCSRHRAARHGSAISHHVERILIGTVLPGIVVIRYGHLMAGGNEIALKEIGPPSAGRSTPTRTVSRPSAPLPHITGMSGHRLPGGILLRQPAGVEVHAVHAPELKKPQTQFLRAAFAALISPAVYAGRAGRGHHHPHDQINLQSTLSPPSRSFDRYHVGWLFERQWDLLVAFALAGDVVDSGPSRGSLWTARDGKRSPCFLQKTNKNGVYRSINIPIIIQAASHSRILSSFHIVMSDVSVAFFPLSALTRDHPIMYMMMPWNPPAPHHMPSKLIRSCSRAGRKYAAWLIGGVSSSLLFSFVVTFSRLRSCP